MDSNLYLSRNIDKNLMFWAGDARRCPLILRGGRQVGKTASITEFGKSFESFVVADFERNPELNTIFAGSLEPQKLVTQMEAVLGERIIPGKTLLFLDEIQECQRAITSLRYFKEKMPELHVIAAGSLLEFALGEISFPVGRVTFEFLYPMTFEEFLGATDRTILAQHIPQFDFSEDLPELSDAIAERLYAALKEYMIVGGMPEAVATFQESKSFLEVQKIQDKLIRGFRDDIPKYASGDLQKRNVAMVFSRLATMVGEQITYTKILDDDPKRNKNSIFLLEKSMLIHRVLATSPSGLPLGAHADEKTFKVVFVDIGLMQRICGRNITNILNTDELDAGFRGQLAEQFVGQQLLATSQGSENGQIYYWRRNAKSSTAEVDYLVVRHDRIVPIEVKSGSSGALRSLHLMLETYPHLEQGICLQTTHKSSRRNRIVFLPLFTHT